MWQKEGLSYAVEDMGFRLHYSAKLPCNDGQRIYFFVFTNISSGYIIELIETLNKIMAVQIP